MSTSHEQEDRFADRVSRIALTNPNVDKEDGEPTFRKMKEDSCPN